MPGVRISEHFPLMATMADRYAIVRTVHHKHAPIHEYGMQLMQTGRLSTSGIEHPHYGAVLTYLTELGNISIRTEILPYEIGNMGTNLSHGQGAGYLPCAKYNPQVLAPNQPSNKFMMKAMATIFLPDLAKRPPCCE